MNMREPPFWWRAPSIEATLLAPAAAIYGWVAARRFAQEGIRTGVPVVCVGNLTLGGAGKTPMALTIARILSEAGEAPVLLSRGYGGQFRGPVLVDPAKHRAIEVGDEPLLLARAAPTVVARDRAAGARAAVAAGATAVVMDDGFQNPALAKNFSVLVMDKRRGLGNGRVFPAGPLRAPLEPQMRRADALVVVGESPMSQVIVDAAKPRGIPVFRAALVPDGHMMAGLAGRSVLAFAGIGDPEKFFATLKNAGVKVAATRPFADHHRYSRAEADALSAEAARAGLTLVTTEKDMARLKDDATLAGLATRAEALPVTLALDEEEAFRTLLLSRLIAARAT
jgi:tetraacyldisaccharide 4'-kinase